MKKEMKKVIVRGRDSGVFFGELVERNGQEVKLKNVRKLWRWYGACAVEQLALDGVVLPNQCKFTVYNDEQEILDIIQVIPCTKKAIESIEGVKIWKE